jgi:putative Mn2+ efflux pump MntP
VQLAEAIGGELPEEAVQPASRAQALRRLLAVLMIAPLISLLLVDSAIPIGTRSLAGVFWILCLLPAWFYLGMPAETRRPIPLLPFIGVLYGLYYPLSVVLGSYNEYFKVTVVPETDYIAPVALGLLGWVFLLFGYLAIEATSLSRTKEWGSNWDLEVVRTWAVRLVVLGAGVELFRHAFGVPVIVLGLITFIASLAPFGLGLLVYLLLRTGLPASSKIVLVVGFVTELVLSFSSGSVAQVVRLVLMLIFAVWVARQSLSMRWIWTALVALCFMLALKGVALEFRRAAWFGQAGLGESVGIMQDLVTRKIQSEGVIPSIQSGVRAVSIRSTLTDLFADVMRRTPAQVPYWEGQTYLHLVGAFVPRFIWPGKPQHHIGNDFGHRYGYVASYDTWTSWNLPVMIEFYVNFGEGAVIVGMFLVGLLIGAFCVGLNRPGQNPLISLAALVLAMMLINIESDFSLMFGAMAMQGAALWAVLALIARDSRKANARRAAAALDEHARAELAPA